MSRKAAEKIQALLVAYIENGNTRVAMEKNDVLIMKEASVPTVIVECGFLSNYEEAVKLNTDDYQNTLARAISDGIMSHLGVEKKTEDNSDIQIVTSE
jgi:N-acetylmuramoyl-L-alanine amidase